MKAMSAPVTPAPITAASHVVSDESGG